MPDSRPSGVLYDRRHFSVPLALLLLFATAVAAWLLYFSKTHYPAWIVVGAALALFLLFCIEHVTVYVDGVVVSYGVGLIVREFPLTILQSATIGLNTSLLSWIYDPLSAEALHLELRGGKRLVIGSSDRRKLVDMLRRRVEAKY